MLWSSIAIIKQVLSPSPPSSAPPPSLSSPSPTLPSYSHSYWGYHYHHIDHNSAVIFSAQFSFPALHLKSLTWSSLRPSGVPITMACFTDDNPETQNSSYSIKLWGPMPLRNLQMGTGLFAVAKPWIWQVLPESSVKGLISWYMSHHVGLNGRKKNEASEYMQCELIYKTLGLACGSVIKAVGPPYTQKVQNQESLSVSCFSD